MPFKYYQPSKPFNTDINSAKQTAIKNNRLKQYRSRLIFLVNLKYKKNHFNENPIELERQIEQTIENIRAMKYGVWADPIAMQCIANIEQNKKEKGIR